MEQELSNDAFVFAEDGRVWWPLVVNVPTDGGKTEEKRPEVLITVPTVPKLQELEKADDPIAALLTLVHDWRNIAVAKGKTDKSTPLKFTKANFMAVCGLPFFLAALRRALRETAAGAEAKNS